MEVWEHVAPV